MGNDIKDPRRDATRIKIAEQHRLVNKKYHDGKTILSFSIHDYGFTPKMALHFGDMLVSAFKRNEGIVFHNSIGYSNQHVLCSVGLETADIIPTYTQCDDVNNDDEAPVYGGLLRGPLLRVLDIIAESDNNGYCSDEEFSKIADFAKAVSEIVESGSYVF